MLFPCRSAGWLGKKLAYPPHHRTERDRETLMRRYLFGCKRYVWGAAADALWCQINVKQEKLFPRLFFHLAGTAKEATREKAARGLVCGKYFYLAPPEPSCLSMSFWGV